MPDTELVAQIMRWDMKVLQESPWYQEILQPGIVKGKLEGERSLVLRLLDRRVGKLPDTLQIKVQSLSLAQLETLGDALLDFADISDLSAWLSANAV